MEQVTQDEVFMTAQQQAYEMESSSSSSSSNIIISDDDDDDEIDAQQALSFEHQNKEEPFATDAIVRGLPEAKVIRTPTVFAPRSPKNYKKQPLRKTKSAESILLSSFSHHSSHHSEHRRFLPPLSSHSKSNHPFESPKSFSKSSDSIPPESQRTMSTFQFPSPFWTPHSSVNFGDFSAVNIINPITTTDDEETAGHDRSIRRISEGDADGTDFPFHQSMDLGDVFPSVFDDTLFGPSSRSMPEIQSPSLFESSINGQSGSVSRGSHLEQAMEIDPFDDDCVRFESRPSSTNSVDWEKQMQDLKEEHAEEVNKLKREIETGNKIITSLTKQVQELMAQNEKLSLQNKKAKESVREYKKRAARIDMMGHVMESPDASPSIQKRKTVDISTIMDLDGGSENHGRKNHGKGGKPKRKSSHKKKNKKANSSTHETMALDDRTAAAAAGDNQSTKKQRSANKGTTNTTAATTGTMPTTTRKRPKSKRNVKQLSFSSIDADEHPLSQAKRRKSQEARSLRHSIAAIDMENNSTRTIASKTTTRSSSKKMSETIESLWAFDWKDPAKAEVKRVSQKKKHHSKKHLAQLKENLEASVGKLPKRTKPKRKTITKRKAKQEATTEEVLDQKTTTTTTNPLTSPIHKAKKISRRSFAAVGRLLSPRAEKRQKRTKTELLPTSVEGDTTSVVQHKLEPAPEL